MTLSINGNYGSHGIPHRPISTYHRSHRSIYGTYVVPIKMIKKSLDKDDSSKEIKSSSKIDQNLSLKITSLTTAISAATLVSSQAAQALDMETIMVSS